MLGSRMGWFYLCCKWLVLQSTSYYISFSKSYFVPELTVTKWSNGRIIALLTIAFVLLIAFVLIQTWRPRTATVPPRIFMQRSILAGFWVSCMVGVHMTMFGKSSTLPIETTYFQLGKRALSADTRIKFTIFLSGFKPSKAIQPSQVPSTFCPW